MDGELLPSIPVVYRGECVYYIFTTYSYFEDLTKQTITL